MPSSTLGPGCESSWQSADSRTDATYHGFESHGRRRRVGIRGLFWEGRQMYKTRRDVELMGREVVQQLVGDLIAQEGSGAQS